MKPTEIEAKQVVSTSGLLTGRPSASQHRRVSALPRHKGARPTTNRSALTSSLSTPTLTFCGVHCTQCDSHEDARHTDTRRSAQRRRGRLSAVSVQGLGPQGRGASALNTRGCGWLRRHQVRQTAVIKAEPGSAQACVSPPYRNLW